ncbi:uncharacterized protein si:ch73-204p21.2 [Megalobrama amblycephala]|uniref:uncharacterized protein si:ch73-204p21.2 n=1 Tax=Megalobrama amblycephala TaxID=75352 RepID=UPI002013C52F|nr:uncharacterized protein si:ch73-204p21.2 [Megalobrama amblycephala]XP_048046697.1 uncharacterized protein si:ch73-204p21.2 [Megalobrama amblycephala]XP_048046698.1 uncharacterized protein si:ch73-204p21.2 [Megalobrama amblycephala]XP_048046699.1 uncharacterized protein si:ch73-204p21.2 [Megalobrama amblycephala]
MAPIGTDVLGWAISEQPEAAFLSLIILFIASIALLALCANCKKHSFELESSSAPEQKSSTLVSVARKDDSTGARHNPAANEITGDEIGLESEDVTISQEGIVYKPWRSHTLTHGSNPPTQINGSVGTTNEGSVTLHAI